MKKILIALVLLLFSDVPASAQTVNFAVGSFTTGTGTTAVEVNVTGAFQPIAYCLTTTSPGDASGSAYGAVAFGCSTDQGTDQQRAVWAGCDEADPSQCYSANSNGRVLIVHNGVGTLIGDLQHTSFDADGFTVTPVDAFTTSTTVYYMAWGGLAVSLETVTTPAAGNFSSTTPGFQPEFLLLFGSRVPGINTTAASAGFSIGFSDCTDAALLSMHAADGQATSNTTRYLRSAAAQLDIFANLNATDDVEDRTSLVSCDANGWTMNQVETASGSYRFFVLAFDGGAWDVGDFLTQTSTGNFTEAHAAFTAKGIFVIHNNTTAQSTVDTASATLSASFGAGVSSTARWTSWTVWGDNSDSNNTYKNVQDATKLGIRYNTSVVVLQEYDLVSFASGLITLNQVDADVAQTFNIYFVVGEIAAGSVGPKRRQVIGQ